MDAPDPPSDHPADLAAAILKRLIATDLSPNHPDFVNGWEATRLILQDLAALDPPPGHGQYISAYLVLQRLMTPDTPLIYAADPLDAAGARELLRRLIVSDSPASDAEVQELLRRLIAS